MAGISGSELASIRQQIREFPDTHSDFMDRSSHRDEMRANMAEGRIGSTEEQQPGIVSEIALLEADIEQLEKAIQEQRKQNGVNEAWQKYQSSPTSINVNTDIASAQLEALKYQIDQLGDITGIKLVDTRTEVIEKDTLWCRKKKYVEGYCGQVEFSLEISLVESMNVDTSVKSTITNMMVTASDSLQKDLGSTITKLTKESNAQGFLQLLQPYNMWWTARETVFKHFSAEYPKVSKRKSTRELHLTHPTKKISFIVKWTFKVTDTYQVVPDIQLSIQIPKHVSPPNAALTTAPQNFQLMLKELGIEATIHSLIMLLIE